MYKNSIDIVTQKALPQIEKGKEYPPYGYISHALHPLYYLNLSKMEYLETIPHLANLAFVPKAGRTDSVNMVSGNFHNLFISPAFWEVLQGFSLPEHQLFEASICYRKKDYPYYVVHFYRNQLEAIDCEKSTFYWFESGKGAIERLQINNLADLQNAIAKKTPTHIVLPKQLHFIEDSQQPFDIVCQRIKPGPMLVTERLKNALEMAKLTGVKFEPIGLSLQYNLRWANTGLPIED
jgi:hypothetical protein